MIVVEYQQGYIDMMAEDNSKETTVELGEEVEFGEELNKNLTNAIFKLDSVALEREDKETPLVELYQIAEKWLKLKFKKSKKTWVIEKDAFASKASQALAKVVDVQKLKDAIAEQVTKLNQDDSSSFEAEIPAQVELQWWTSGVGEMSEESTASLCKKIWTGLTTDGAWRSSLEDKITDQNISRDIYHSLVNPFKQDGTQCKDGEFVVVAKPYRSCWYTEGNYIPGSSVQIWHRAIDPIAWFGKRVAEKPKTLTSYDSPDVALEPPTKELKEATLAEDEAFGYAK